MKIKSLLHCIGKEKKTDHVEMENNIHKSKRKKKETQNLGDKCVREIEKEIEKKIII